MAKVKFGMIVVEARNKLGGHVFSRNRGGAYTRTKVTPLNPQTTFQQAQRNLLDEFSTKWRTLSVAERAAWNGAVENFAKTDIFGDLRNPSGQQLYIRLNINLAIAGAGEIFVPPAPSGAASVDSLSITVDSVLGDFDVAFTPTPVPAGNEMIIEATPALSPGINNANSDFVVLTTVAAAVASPVAIETAWTARFGALIAGQKYFVRAKMTNITTGEVSVRQVASAIAT